MMKFVRKVVMNDEVFRIQVKWQNQDQGNPDRPFLPARKSLLGYSYLLKEPSIIRIHRNDNWE